MVEIKKVVVAGGTGFIGKALVKRLLKEGYHVVVLTRNPDVFKTLPDPNLKTVLWDGSKIAPRNQVCTRFLVASCNTF